MINTKEYHGVVILKADKNSSGIRWTARNNGVSMRADTLKGIKKSIQFSIMSVSNNK